MGNAKPRHVTRHTTRNQKILLGRTLSSNDLMDPGQDLVFIAEFCIIMFERHKDDEI